MDTDAQVSAIPPTPVQRKHPGLCLQAVTNSTISTYGNQLLMLDLGLRRSFRWIFVIADVQTPILGADFLQHFGLLVDVRHTCLLDEVTKLKVQGILSATSLPSPSVLPKQSLNEFHAILLEFSELLQLQCGEQPVKHDITHHIVTTGPPIKARTCRLSPEQLKIARQEFEHILQQGAAGPLLYTCCPRNHLGIGVHVEIIVV